MRWRHGEKCGGIRGDRGKKEENPVRFITPICIMGLIGPQCVFSGVSRNGEGEGGRGRGDVDQEKARQVQEYTCLTG